MKNIINTSKRSIIVILTLCILLCTTGIGVHAISMPEENIAVTAEETTVVVQETKVAIEGITVADEETTSELMPMMARACGYGDLASWYNIDHATKASILGDVSGNYKAVVGNNPDIYYSSNGLIYLCGTGAYSGRTYPTDLQRSWYL